MTSYVDRKELPGLVALISHNDEVHVESLGTMAVGDTSPMKRDAIFRVASLVKPVTAAAAMILVEEGKLRLGESIEPWLPELSHRRVLTSLPAGADETVPALRPITVRDVLTFRMGFGSVMAPPDTYPIQKLIRENRIGGDGPPRPDQAPGADEWLRRLGSLPWMAQPGERWMYHVSGDVLGVLVARVAGQSLGTFMRQRIFDPLGMKDTAFHVPSEKVARLPSCYVFDREANSLKVFDDARKSAWRSAPAFESGGGGLVSTIDDYFAFCRMMLNKGRHGRGRILSRASVELMTSDHVLPGQRAGAEMFFETHSSWGFGMAVNIRRSEIYQTPGRFGWDGGCGTTAYTDPVEGVIGILFTQRMMDSPEPPKVFSDFWTSAYGALE